MRHNTMESAIYIYVKLKVCYRNPSILLQNVTLMRKWFPLALNEYTFNSAATHLSTLYKTLHSFLFTVNTANIATQVGLWIYQLPKQCLLWLRIGENIQCVPNPFLDWPQMSLQALSTECRRDIREAWGCRFICRIKKWWVGGEALNIKLGLLCLCPEQLHHEVHPELWLCVAHS